MPVMKQAATRDLSFEVAAETPVEAVSCNAAAAGPKPQAAETRRLYAADWGAFAVWCAQKRQAALPAAPASVATYLTSLSTTLGLGALARRSAAIADRHRRAGHA
ncbi:MAG: hypothetical protein ACRYHQ_32360 [Janthinobacterium lividum]